MPDPRYLTIEEAAELARTPVKSVRVWIYDGRLPSFRPGKRVLIRRDDLVALIERRPLPSREERAA
jgi:excisionase family DNA binding protein